VDALRLHRICILELHFSAQTSFQLIKIIFHVFCDLKNAN